MSSDEAAQRREISDRVRSDPRFLEGLAEADAEAVANPNPKRISGAALAAALREGT